MQQKSIQKPYWHTIQLNMCAWTSTDLKEIIWTFFFSAHGVMLFVCLLVGRSISFYGISPNEMHIINGWNERKSRQTLNISFRAYCNCLPMYNTEKKRTNNETSMHKAWDQRNLVVQFWRAKCNLSCLIIKPAYRFRVWRSFDIPCSFGCACSLHFCFGTQTFAMHQILFRWECDNAKCNAWIHFLSFWKWGTPFFLHCHRCNYRQQHPSPFLFIKKQDWERRAVCLSLHVKQKNYMNKK